MQLLLILLYHGTTTCVPFYSRSSFVKYLREKNVFFFEFFNVLDDMKNHLFSWAVYSQLLFFFFLA